MTDSSGRKIDAVGIVDESPIGKLIITIAILCAGVSFSDGFDILAISYVAPVVGAQWHLSRVAFGPIFAAHYIGAAGGSLLFGLFADRYGRRLGVIIPTVIFGLTTLFTIYAYDFKSLFAFRLVTGIGLGGALSNAIALVAEYAPHRARATLVSVMYAAFPLGGVIGGPISALIISHYGWHGVFVLGGVVPLLLTVALTFGLRESIRYLILSNGPGENIGIILQRISPSFRGAPSDIYVLPEGSRVSTKPMWELFSREYIQPTLLLSLAAFNAQLVIVYVVSWMPLVLASIGRPVTNAILASVAFSIGGVFGAIGLARIVDQDKSYRGLVMTFFLSAASIAGVGYFATNWYALLAITFITGLLTIGANIVLSAYSATIYRTAIRSTGVGWIIGWGRIGAIAGAMFGTGLVAGELGVELAYMTAAIPAVIGGLAIASVPKRRFAKTYT